MKWGDFIARTVVRRVVYVVVALVLAWVGIGRAQAQDYSGCYNVALQGSACPHKGDAYTNAEAAANDRNARLYPTQGYQVEFHSEGVQSGTHLVVYYGIKNPGGGYVDTTYRTWPKDAGCPAGTEWDESSKTCHDPQECLSKPPLGETIIRGGQFQACSGGCVFEPNAPLTIAVGDGAGAFTVSSGWEPTGAACTVGEATPAPSDQPQECVPVGGQTMCVKPDGDHCYSAGTGRQICWDPGETGEKTDGPVKQRRDPGETPQPPTPPTNGDTLEQQGEPIKTVTSGGGRNITTITSNYGTASGADAGGSNQGQTGTGDGDGEGDDGEGGGVGPGIGDVYEGSGKTIDGVIANFRVQVLQSPLIGAAAGFMGNCAFSGQCPVWSYDGGEYMGVVTFEALCNGALQGLLSYAGWIVMALAAFAAFRIAIY